MNSKPTYISNLHKHTYNKIAVDWDKAQVDTNWWIKGRDAFISYLPRQATILDVGCGNGSASQQLVQAGFSLTGFDISEEMIKLAQLKVPSGKFFVLDINEVDTISEKFDGIYAQAVLLHLPRADVPVTLKKLTQLLKPRGYIYVAVKEIKSNTPSEEIKKEHEYGYEYERFFSYFTLEELRAWYKECDLHIVQEIISTSGRATWLQIIGQKI